MSVSVSIPANMFGKIDGSTAINASEQDDEFENKVVVACQSAIRRHLMRTKRSSVDMTCAMLNSAIGGEVNCKKIKRRWGSLVSFLKLHTDKFRLVQKGIDFVVSLISEGDENENGPGKAKSLTWPTAIGRPPAHVPTPTSGSQSISKQSPPSNNNCADAVTGVHVWLSADDKDGAVKLSADKLTASASTSNAKRWAGGRAAVSVCAGRSSFECVLWGEGVARLGWSSASAPLVVEGCDSYCYEGTGTIIACTPGYYECIAYGERFKAGDVIGCFLDWAVGEISYSKNGVWLGVAHAVRSDSPLFPTYYLDSCSVTFNFGASRPLFSSLFGGQHVYGLDCSQTVHAIGASAVTVTDSSARAEVSKASSIPMLSSGLFRIKAHLAKALRRHRNRKYLKLARTLSSDATCALHLAEESEVTEAESLNWGHLSSQVWEIRVCEDPQGFGKSDFVLGTVVAQIRRLCTGEVLGWAGGDPNHGAPVCLISSRSCAAVEHFLWALQPVGGTGGSSLTYTLHPCYHARASNLVLEMSGVGKADKGGTLLALAQPDKESAEASSGSSRFWELHSAGEAYLNALGGLGEELARKRGALEALQALVDDQRLQRVELEAEIRGLRASKAQAQQSSVVSSIEVVAEDGERSRAVTATVASQMAVTLRENDSEVTYESLKTSAFIPATAEDARLVVDTIRSEHMRNWFADDELSRKWAQHLRRVLPQVGIELHSQRANVILELLQNADDCNYADDVSPSVSIQLDTARRALVVHTNELGFRVSNVVALCDISHSDKSGNSTVTGQKGVGFKSVFVLGDDVCVHSRYLRFGFFLKDASGRRDVLNQLIPHWIEDSGATYFDGTEIVVSVNPPRSSLSGQDWSQECLDCVSAVGVSLLLCTRRLRQLTVTGTHEQLVFSVMRVDAPAVLVPIESHLVDRATLTKPIHRRNISTLVRRQAGVNAAGMHTDSLASSELQTQSLEFVQYSTQIELSSQKLASVQVTIPVMSSEEFQAFFPDGFHVHATLPAEAAGLNILINADWQLNTERTSIPSCQRNEETMLGIIAFLEALFLTDDSLKRQWMRYIPRVQSSQLKSAVSFLAIKLRQWKQSDSFKKMIAGITRGKELLRWAGRATCIPLHIWETSIPDKFFLNPADKEHALFCSDVVVPIPSALDALTLWTLYHTGWDSPDTPPADNEKVEPVQDGSCSQKSTVVLSLPLSTRNALINWVLSEYEDTAGPYPLPLPPPIVDALVKAPNFWAWTESRGLSSSRFPVWEVHPLFNSRVFVEDDDSLAKVLGASCWHICSSSVDIAAMIPLIKRMTGNAVELVTQASLHIKAQGCYAAKNLDELLHWIRFLAKCVVHLPQWWAEFIASLRQPIALLSASGAWRSLLCGSKLSVVGQLDYSGVEEMQSLSLAEEYVATLLGWGFRAPDMKRVTEIRIDPELGGLGTYCLAIVEKYRSQEGVLPVRWLLRRQSSNEDGEEHAYFPAHTLHGIDGCEWATEAVSIASAVQWPTTADSYWLPAVVWCGGMRVSREYPVALLAALEVVTRMDTALVLSVLQMFGRTSTSPPTNWTAARWIAVVEKEGNTLPQTGLQALPVLWNSREWVRLDRVVVLSESEKVELYREFRRQEVIFEANKSGFYIVDHPADAEHWRRLTVLSWPLHDTLPRFLRKALEVQREKQLEQLRKQKDAEREKERRLEQIRKQEEAEKEKEKVRQIEQMQKASSGMKDIEVEQRSPCLVVPQISHTHQGPEEGEELEPLQPGSVRAFPAFSFVVSSEEEEGKGIEVTSEQEVSAGLEGKRKLGEDLPASEGGGKRARKEEGEDEGEGEGEGEGGSVDSETAFEAVSTGAVGAGAAAHVPERGFDYAHVEESGRRAEQLMHMYLTQCCPGYDPWQHWRSSNRDRTVAMAMQTPGSDLFPEPKSQPLPTNDALGFDFVVTDSSGDLGGVAGHTVYLEVKSSVSAWDRGFLLSSNEEKVFQQTKREEGKAYVVALFACQSPGVLEVVSAKLRDGANVPGETLRQLMGLHWVDLRTCFFSEPWTVNYHITPTRVS